MIASIVFAMAIAASPAPEERPWALALHGGAGVIERAALTPEQDAAYRASLASALKAGSDVLEGGGSALDAVEKVVRQLEDDPLFNAGRGAVFTADGRNELDASIMDGATLKAGAVAGVTRTRHPVSLARSVMERSPHVMLQGAGADAYSLENGLEQVEPAWLFSERRWRSLEKALTAAGLPIPPRPEGAPPPGPVADLVHDEGKHGTVGAVALDRAGNVAAATSTGGTTAKRWGRVGDSPIIGAGNYAANAGCAVSGTGTGEYFIRLTVARTICALVEMKGMSLQAAADQVIQGDLNSLGGDGGVIAVAPNGQVAWSFNTPGMSRARAGSGLTPQVSLYKDEP